MAAWCGSPAIGDLPALQASRLHTQRDAEHFAEHLITKDVLLLANDEGKSPGTRGSL
jgi:hypothetical protein